MQISLLYLLLIIHLIVDFMQPADLVAWSKSSSWGLTVHSSIYFVLNCAALVFTPLWWIWAFVLGLSHFVIDKLKVVLNNRFPNFGLQIFVLDQVVHIAIICSAFYLGKLGISKPIPLSMDILNYPQILLYIMSFIAVTFGGSILIFEVLNAQSTGRNQKKVIYIGERYLGILERTTGLLIILLGRINPIILLAVPLAFIPSTIRGKKAWRSKDERRSFILEFGTSVSLVLFAGTILYFI